MTKKSFWSWTARMGKKKKELKKEQKSLNLSINISRKCFSLLEKNMNPKASDVD